MKYLVKPLVGSAVSCSSKGCCYSSGSLCIHSSCPSKCNVVWVEC